MSDYSLFGNSYLPPELDSRVRTELSSGERLLWVGQPQPGRSMRAAIPIVLFGLPWTAFAIFWMAGASGLLLGGFGNGPPAAFRILFPLFGLPFVLIGLGMLSAPFWLRRRAKRTCYALTDRRAILWQAGWFGGIEVRSYGPEELTQIHRTQYADGSGSLVFEELVSFSRNSRGHVSRSTTRRGFMYIDNVRAVEELLRKALLSDAAGGGD